MLKCSIESPPTEPIIGLPGVGMILGMSQARAQDFRKGGSINIIVIFVKLYFTTRGLAGGGGSQSGRGFE